MRQENDVEALRVKRERIPVVLVLVARAPAYEGALQGRPSRNGKAARLIGNTTFWSHSWSHGVTSRRSVDDRAGCLSRVKTRTWRPRRIIMPDGDHRGKGGHQVHLHGFWRSHRVSGPRAAGRKTGASEPIHSLSRLCSPSSAEPAWHWTRVGRAGCICESVSVFVEEGVTPATPQN